MTHLDSMIDMEGNKQCMDGVHTRMWETKPAVNTETVPANCIVDEIPKGFAAKVVRKCVSLAMACEDTGESCSLVHAM